jgi:hypothetical protein
MTFTMTQQASDNMGVTVTKPLLGDGSSSCTSSFAVGSFVLSGVVVQEPPPSPNTASAAVSSAINHALALVTIADDSDYGDDIDTKQQNTMFRKELLKDDMSLLYFEQLAKMRVHLTWCLDDESDFDDEEEEEDDGLSCFLGLLVEDESCSSSDEVVFDLFKRRFGGTRAVVE